MLGGSYAPESKSALPAGQSKPFPETAERFPQIARCAPRAALSQEILHPAFSRTSARMVEIESVKSFESRVSRLGSR
jgi:hypothetical protein